MMQSFRKIRIRLVVSGNGDIIVLCGVNIISSF